jgi:hypothetical protein
MKMPELPEPNGEIQPPSPIRVETALSRYPVHRLAKHGDITIDVREKTLSGDVSIKWEVTHNSKYGQPGPMAYKLDTLIVNRKIEETTRPIPRLIRLGSLHDICRQLGISEGRNREAIKNALYQNASAFITSKIVYRLVAGGEKSLEAGFNRYQVVFTGEELPDGRKADAVYIILSDVYMQVINGATTRPLDYDYLKSLPPAPQRFYELLSYQMYAAIKNDKPRAKLVYSELCTYAPLTRHLDWEHARSQLAKIHRPHKASGYIAQIDFQDALDSSGKPDWIMLYQPGPKARAEYRAFAKRGGPVTLEVEPITDAVPSFAASKQPALPLGSSSPSPQEVALIGHGVTPAKAAELAGQHNAETIAEYIEYLEYEMAKKPGKIADPAAWLFSAFKDGRSKPKGFVSRAERERRAEEKKTAERQAAEARRQERQKQAAAKAEREALAAYWNALTPEEQVAHDAAAIAQADAEDRKLIEPGPMKRIGLTLLRDKYTRRLLQAEGKLPPSTE